MDWNGIQLRSLDDGIAETPQFFNANHYLNSRGHLLCLLILGILSPQR